METGQSCSLSTRLWVKVAAVVIVVLALVTAYLVGRSGGVRSGGNEAGATGNATMESQNAPAVVYDYTPVSEPDPGPNDGDMPPDRDALKPMTVKVTEEAFGQDVTMTPGDTLEFSLRANDTTAFSWRCTVEPEGVLELVEDRYDPDPSPGGATGVGGTQVYTLKAVEIGQATVTLTHSVWNADGTKAGDAPLKSGTITVNVAGMM